MAGLAVRADDFADASADDSGSGVLIETDDRGAVYLGPERYLAGETDRGIVVSYVPGHAGRCRDMDDLISRWEAFRLEGSSYDPVLHPGTARETMLADAPEKGCYAPAADKVRRQLRDKLGRDEKQSERTRRTNEERERKKREELCPW